MQKQKKYDWKDSNMALFGSDTEKNVKKDSAKTEPAWNGAGEKVGVQIWRIVKFQVEHWSRDQYGMLAFLVKYQVYVKKSKDNFL